MSRFLAAFALAILPTAAFAHSGHPLEGGFLLGFLHPFGGADHALAALGVGFWSVREPPKNRVAPVALFFLGLTVGYAAGFAPSTGTAIDWALGLSVIALGAAIIGERRVAPWVASAAFGAFGLLHGHAHGVELPASIAAPSYGFGLFLATVALSALGGLFGWAMKSERVAKLTGCAMLAAGACLTLN